MDSNLFWAGFSFLGILIFMVIFMMFGPDIEIVYHSHEKEFDD